ncbi:MAG: ribose-5-phosphate isomerase RpiA [Gemmataceae bacterium]|nr:ribose-5-phosphate isomerase RpiA [Gemmataceae bacterium]
MFDLILEDIHPGMVLGLGSGRTTLAFVRALGKKVAQGLSCKGVPTSTETAILAGEMGISLLSLDQLDDQPIDLTVDGADEVDSNLNLIKGYGRALVREKIIACSSKRVVILVGTDKVVKKLGDRGKLPVEIVSFALPMLQKKLKEWGTHGQIWQGATGPNLTDNGNPILDCATEGVANVPDLARKIRLLPGVVDTGFFEGIADQVLVGDEKQGFQYVRTLNRMGAAKD